jgi:hypothetical protein
MKSQRRMTIVAAALLSIPALTFAGGQPAKVRMPGKADVQDRAGITRAVQQGKGTGMSRRQTANRANSGAASVKYSDPAYTR